ncbi:helix-turn-helix domain-containing protein [Streptomyces uncialis]|uniref:helix-turn-helix domain-containing protein n=1 Tax=Streptomyces uncialis TaxID=1048205 RepID=UPI00381F37EA
MSIALMIVAAYLPPEVVTVTEKLALMKLADSADDDTRLSVPTQRRLVAWVGVGEKRVSTVITSLVAKGLVERVATAREGRSAVYRVFPEAVPVTPQREELDERLRGMRARPTNPRLARHPKAPRRKPSGPARTYLDVQQRKVMEGHDALDAGEPPGGEGDAAGTSGNPPGFRGGNPGAESGPDERVSPGKPPGFRGGNRQGFAGETPSFPSSPASVSSSTTPPPPTASAAGELSPRRPDQVESAGGCPKHQGGPGANCRACGTTARAARERARRVQEDRERDATSRWWASWHEERRDREQRAGEVGQEARRATRAAIKAHQQVARRGGRSPEK